MADNSKVSMINLGSILHSDGNSNSWVQISISPIVPDSDAKCLRLPDLSDWTNTNNNSNWIFPLSVWLFDLRPSHWYMWFCTLAKSSLAIRGVTVVTSPSWLSTTGTSVVPTAGISTLGAAGSGPLSIPNWLAETATEGLDRLGKQVRTRERPDNGAKGDHFYCPAWSGWKKKQRHKATTFI